MLNPYVNSMFPALLLWIFSRISSLPDDVESLQNRMSFTATDVPPLMTINDDITSNDKAAMGKIRNFGSRFSSMIIRQAAPKINKLAAQGFFS